MYVIFVATTHFHSCFYDISTPVSCKTYQLKAVTAVVFW